MPGLETVELHPDWQDHPVQIRKRCGLKSMLYLVLGFAPVMLIILKIGLAVGFGLVILALL